MSEHVVTFDGTGVSVKVPTGTLLVEAARLAELQISQPCGGQGRCGRCIVQVVSGAVRRRSTLRLSPEDVSRGYALACQTVIEGDVTISIPPQEKVERRLTTDRTLAEVTVPPGYDFRISQTIHRLFIQMSPPNLEDQTDDWSRLRTALRQHTGISVYTISLANLQRLSAILRQADWQVTVVIDVQKSGSEKPPQARIIAVHPGRSEKLWGVAIDIGTTTLTLWLVDLVSGQVQAQVSEYNQQINRGEDVVSRIIYASKGNGLEEMRNLVVDTINQLIRVACKRTNIVPEDIVKATIAGNSTMTHLFLGLDAQSIRLSPYITTVNHIPLLVNREAGLAIHPEATVECLPCVASYVGSDITAGVMSSGMDESETLTLFMDVGTNGEIVLGMRDWLVACACSAGPAFEGAGVQDGMRATTGAIEEVWIAGKDSEHPFEPTYRVIGNVKPRGICGSGLLSLLAELFLEGIVDKGGNFNTSLSIPRLREGKHGYEYVVVWADQTQHGQDIVFTRIDIDNLLRAKAAIYAGFTVLADSVGVPLELVEQVSIGGSFGKYINVEKAIQIGLLPDMPWDRFQFLGNTSVKGAYFALLDQEVRQKIDEIARRMTYVELSADNTFYEAFMSALFLPHTDLSRFPSVVSIIN